MQQQRRAHLRALPDRRPQLQGLGTQQVPAFVVNAAARELIQTRCSRSAQIAWQLRFPQSIAEAVQGLDEHFDGSGSPDALRGGRDPAGLATVFDPFGQA